MKEACPGGLSPNSAGSMGTARQKIRHVLAGVALGVGLVVGGLLLRSLIPRVAEATTRLDVVVSARVVDSRTGQPVQSAYVLVVRHPDFNFDEEVLTHTQFGSYVEAGNSGLGITNEHGRVLVHFRPSFGHPPGTFSPRTPGIAQIEVRAVGYDRVVIPAPDAPPFPGLGKTWTIDAGTIPLPP